MENQKFVQCPHSEITVLDTCLNNCEQCSVKRWTDPTWSLMEGIRISPRKTI